MPRPSTAAAAPGRTGGALPSAGAPSYGCPMTQRTLTRVAGLAVAAALVLAAAGCDQAGKIGGGAKDKINQGGNAGGSTGYP